MLIGKVLPHYKVKLKTKLTPSIDIKEITEPGRKDETFRFTP